MPLPNRLATVLLLGAVGTGVHAATPCSLASTGAARVMRAEQPLVLPAALADCEGLRVQRGPVVACVQDRRERLACRKLDGDTTIEARHLPTPGSGRNWLDVVLWLLRGDGDAVGAVSRRSVLAGLPAGTVAFVGDMPEIAPGRAGLEAVDSIDFRDAASGDVVLTLTRTSTGPLSREPFRPGRAYVWTVRSSDAGLDEATQRFRVLGTAESAEVRAEVEQVAADTGTAPVARALSVAAVLSRRGLEFDARQALTRAGFAAR